MAGIKIVDLPALGRDLISTDLLEVSLNGSGSRKITGQEIMNASKLAVGSTPIVSGTVGRLLFQNTGDVLGQSANLFWDNTNGRLGIGTSSPAFRLEVQGGDVRFANGLTIGTAGSTGWQFSSNTLTIIQNGFLGVDVANGREFSITNTAFSTTYFKIAATTGNVLINTTTDAGFRLDVNGTARVTSSLRVESSFTALSSATIGGTTLAANAILQVNGSGKYVNYNSSFSSGSFLTYQAFGTWEAIGADSPAGTILAFGGYRASQWTGITFHSNGSERMRIDASGNVGIGTSSPATLLDVNGTIKSSILRSDVLNNTSNTVTLIQFSGTGNRLFDSAGTQVLNLRGGNLQIGTTTDAGFKLDVNGTARIGGGFTIDSTTAPVFKGVNPLTGVTNPTSGGLLLTTQTGSTAMGIAGTYGGAGSRLTLFNNYTDATTSRIKINLGGVDTACFFADGSLQIGNGETTIASAILSASSTTRGFLPPRMTNAQRAAIASPAVGLIVYCTDSTEGLYVYKSTGWTFMV